MMCANGIFLFGCALLAIAPGAVRAGAPDVATIKDPTDSGVSEKGSPRKISAEGEVFVLRLSLIHI